MRTAARFLPLLAAACAIAAGVTSAAAAPSPPAPTTTTLAISAADCNGDAVTYTSSSATNTVTPSSTLCVPAGEALTIAVTVEADTAAPTGTVALALVDGAGAVVGDLGDFAVTPVDSTHSQRTVLVTPDPTTTAAAIRAVYLPDTGFKSSRPPVIPISIAPVVLHTTTTTLEVDGAVGSKTIAAGDTTTVTATVTPNSPDTTAPTGSVTFYDGSGTSNRVGDGPVQLVNGTATLPDISSWSVGTHQLSAIYSGDVFYPSGNGSTPGAFTLTVVPGPPQTVTTDTTVTADPSVFQAGTIIHITAQIVQTGPPVGPLGGLVRFDADGVPIGGPQTLVVDASGVGTATLDWGAWNPGLHTIHAQYQGDTFNNASGGDTTILVWNSPSTTTYGGATTATVGSAATVSALLADDAGAPISKRTVTFSADGQSCSAVTATGTGIASCPITFPHAGTYPVTASFAGDADYGPSRDDTATIVVEPAAPTLTYTGDVHAEAGDTATLSAKLMLGATPLPNELIHFALDGHATCSGTTGPDGVASCSATFDELPTSTTYAVLASFGGDADYTAVTATGTLAVDARAATTLALDSVGPAVQQGGALPLGATLTRSAGGTPVSGEYLTLTFGDQSCRTDEPTDSSGHATCTIRTVSAPLGRQTSVAANFDGDASYRASSASGAMPYVYALAPGGTFVVGDRTSTATGATVTFWGSQWSKLNPLSHGGAPNEFKGFAATAAGPMQCGATWTTRPGNSTPPPNGIPAYMAVAVSSSITKRGSTISGDVQQILIVATGTGYASDPGHAGTGTVVASLCG